jgi:hypothetical protein
MSGVSAAAAVVKDEVAEDDDDRAPPPRTEKDDGKVAHLFLFMAATGVTNAATGATAGEFDVIKMSRHATVAVAVTDLLK